MTAHVVVVAVLMLLALLVDQWPDRPVALAIQIPTNSQTGDCTSMFDILINALAGGAAANHDHQVHGTDAMQANSNLFAASQHRESAAAGRNDQAAWWGGYAGRAAGRTTE